jgi:multicomponent Na+:H+ antiporter subunit G
MELTLEIASWICLTVGSAFCVIGGVGLLRLPDLYTRTHAASITDTLGAGLLLVGLALQAGLSLVSVKLLMVYGFMLITGPAASHALVKAAYAQGVKANVEEDHPHSLRPSPDEIGG